MKNQQIAKKEDAPVTVYQVFDALDDEQIVAEIEGRITQAWVYDAGGKIGISKKGVDQCTLEMAKQGWVFNELNVDIKDDTSDPEYRLFSAKVQAYRFSKSGDKFEQGIQIGSKRQWIKMKDHGNIVPDPFWYEKGCAKAIRNAKMRFIPVEIEAAIVALSKQAGRVKRVDKGMAKVSSPKPTEKDRQTIAEEFEQPYVNGANDKDRDRKRMRYLMHWVNKEFKAEDDAEIKNRLGEIVGETVTSKSAFVENDDHWNKFAAYCQEILSDRAHKKDKDEDDVPY